MNWYKATTQILKLTERTEFGKLSKHELNKYNRKC